MGIEVDKFTISSYELTSEGEERLTFLEKSLWGKEKSGPSKKERDVLSIIASGLPITNKKEEYLVKDILPSLIDRELVIRVDTSNTKVLFDRLLASLPSESARKDLSIYRRISEGEASDSEVDYLFLKSRRALKVIKEMDRGGLESRGGSLIGPNSIDNLISLVNSAETRSDKIIAIDSTMSLYHDLGTLAPPGFDWNTESEEEYYELAPKVDRFLTALSEQ